MDAPPPLDQASLNKVATHLQATKMYALASFVMLVFDITITMGDEVEKIWKQRFTGATLLYLLNRYLSPLGYVVIVASFHSNWPADVCERYVLYPEILKIITAFVIGVIFILRLYSIYSRSMTVLISFSLLLVAELVTKIWAFTDGTHLILPPQLTGCFLVGRGPPAKRMVYTWVAELVFDSVVFFATLWRTAKLYCNARMGTAQYLLRVIMRDGILYFGVIFGANVLTVVMFIVAAPDLKIVNASFSTLVTTLMVSRLMLNLRREATRTHPVVLYRLSENSGMSSGDLTQHGPPRYSVPPPKGLAGAIIGNLGAPVSDWSTSDDESLQSRNRQPSRGRMGVKDNIELRTRGPGTITVEISEEVVVDVDNAIQYSSNSHEIERPKISP